MEKRGIPSSKTRSHRHAVAGFSRGSGGTHIGGGDRVADRYQPTARGIAHERRATETQCIFEHVEYLGFGDRSHRGKADRALHARIECTADAENVSEHDLDDCRILEIQFEPAADPLHARRPRWSRAASSITGCRYPL